jgi:hypothetical protein
VGAGHIVALPENECGLVFLFQRHAVWFLVTREDWAFPFRALTRGLAPLRRVVQPST